MDKRPEKSKAQRGGCCAILFFLPFGAMGVFAILSALGHMMDWRWTPNFKGEPWVGLLVGLLFAAVGIGGVIGTLWAVRRAGSRRPEGKGLKGVPLATSVFPSLRSAKPSRTGRVLLGPETTPAGKFVALAIFALIWNTISWGGMESLLNKRGPSGPEYIGIAVVGLFCLVGLLLLGALIHTFLRLLMVGRTGVEIDSEPLAPGSRTQLAVRQPGRFTIDSAVVRLLCREVVQYRQGTDTVTHTETVHEELLCESKRLRASSTMPILETAFSIPEDAMHSFQSAHNQLQWAIEVALAIPRRPDVKDLYVFRVGPRPRG